MGTAMATNFAITLCNTDALLGIRTQTDKQATVRNDKDTDLDTDNGTLA